MSRPRSEAGPGAFPPRSCDVCQIRSLPPYRTLCERRPLAIEALRSAQLHYKKGAIIRSEEETSQRVYTLYSGWTFRSRTTRDGRRQILSFQLPGDLLGFEGLGGARCGTAIRALTDVALCEFEGEPLLSLLIQAKDTAQDCATDHARYHAASEQAILALGRYSATERMVQLLLSLRARLLARGMQARERFYLPLRRDEFADALGLTPVHVSRTLAKLKRDGLLEFRQNHITILDEARLLKIAETLNLDLQ